MESRMDWERLSQRRASRRWFLGAAGAAGAGWALAACGGNGDRRAPATGPAVETAEASPEPARRPSIVATPGPRQGQTLRYTGVVIRDESFDPHRTQASPLFGQQAMVYSRLLTYADQAEGKIVPDLVSKFEQPDTSTFVFTIHPDARWHDRAPLNGRPVTAEDVKVSIERQLTGDATFVRRPNWANVDKVETTDPARITFKLKAPLASMPSRFADVSAFIVPVEAAKDPGMFTAGQQIGSGPFQWVDWADAKFASVSRNPRWHGGPDRPMLDGVSLSQAANAVEVEGLLRTKKLDVAVLGRPQADRIKRAIPALNETTQGHASFYGMRFFIRQVPYTDQRVRSALSIAIDRRAMLDRFFQGSGERNGWVSWPMKQWALPEAELAALPGYRAGSGGRDADIAEARALLAASPQKIPDGLPIFVPEDTEASLGLGALIKEQLKEALGINVAVFPVGIGELVQRLLSGQAPWAAGPDNGWADLDDWLYPFFHSDGTKNSFAIRDTELDSLINAQRTEFDNAKRREYGLQAQRRLLTLNVGVNFVSERLVTLSWPYVKNFPLDAGDGYQHRFADCSIDTGDASFRGR